MKILIARLQHETNTSDPTKADWGDFVQGGVMPCMTHGNDVMDLRGFNIPMGGFLEAMHATPNELIPVIWISAYVSRDTFEWIAGKMVKLRPKDIPMRYTLIFMVLWLPSI